MREKSKTSPVLVVGLLAAAAAAFHIWHDKREEREKEDRRRKRKAFDKAKRARRRDEERRDRRAAAEEDDDLVDIEMEATRRRRISWHPEGSRSEDNSTRMLEAPPSDRGNESDEEIRRIEHRREQSTARGG